MTRKEAFELEQQTAGCRHQLVSSRIHNNDYLDVFSSSQHVLSPSLSLFCIKRRNQGRERELFSFVFSFQSITDDIIIIPPLGIIFKAGLFCIVHRKGYFLFPSVRYAWSSKMKRRAEEWVSAEVCHLGQRFLLLCVLSLKWKRMSLTRCVQWLSLSLALSSPRFN